MNKRLPKMIFRLEDTSGVDDGKSFFAVSMRVPLRSCIPAA